MTIEPDTKDWTWVLERPCTECGFDPAAYSLADLPDELRRTTMIWSEVLGRHDVGVRPDPTTWSSLEYACHVRDVHRVFAERVRLILTEDTPQFANWDQDDTAVAERYGTQEPSAVEIELIEAAGTVAGMYAAVPAGATGRRGVRSDGSEFTVETLAIYHLHDVLHHVHDVGAS